MMEEKAYRNLENDVAYTLINEATLKKRIQELGRVN